MGPAMVTVMSPTYTHTGRGPPQAAKTTRDETRDRLSEDVPRCVTRQQAEGSSLHAACLLPTPQAGDWVKERLAGLKRE